MSEYDFPVGYRPYPRYRDFGISRVQAIPAHWHPKKVKHLGKLRGGAGFPHQDQGATTEEIPFFKVSDMGAQVNSHEMLEAQHTVSMATARRLRASVFPPGTIVFAKVGAALFLDRRRIVRNPSCIDNNMMD